ncbi:PP2C family protein-serine/threonine phosphatase [Streptomyces oceani]|uniref:Stage II sporulation protein E n=1 Tax=Streptomyces oceani TaxID=1075402 RepID=A0A1E7KMR4_9ACTN|nr:PP2C family protein-serine/threonine phosphatase [Streptomyces oceani]OEV05262.1 stage II sporulation protein E [Streptomyces oceani]
MFRTLLTSSHLSTLEQLPELVNRYAAPVGLLDVLIYLADLQQEVLSPVTGEASAVHAEEKLNVDGTVAGRAFQHGEILPVSPSEADRWWVPLLDGTERLGVLRITAAQVDPTTVVDMRALASLIALMVVSKRDLSDYYERLVRRRRMNVAAEMEWRLMPSRTFATDRVMISGVMEPAYAISGDAFDYAVDGRTVHLAVFDAMGHDTAAGLTVQLALGAARNARRHGVGLAECSVAVEDALRDQFGYLRYVTGIIATLDTETGALEWLSRGHHPPVIIRSRATVNLDCPPAPPMGTDLTTAPVTVCRHQLHPGDRLLLYTDGIIEARSARGQEFGLERFTDFLIRHQVDELPVPETLRRLVRRHLEFHQGKLDDDATVLLLEWHGPAGYAPSESADLVGLPRAGGDA